jgi:ABC-type uncharacterized transport system substrate-binding protein
MMRPMPNLARILIALAISLVAAAAQAHPHVWVAFRSEVVYAPDGSVTGIRHAWSFDDMFSTFATQGIEAKEKGKFTREELAPLAEVNVTSLKEFDYFTYVTADGQKQEIVDPSQGEYWLDYKDSVLTLNFTLPLKKPVKARDLQVEVYDPTVFVDFALEKNEPVKLAGAPTACKLVTELPRELTFAESKRLSQIGPTEKNTSMAIGAQLANKIKVSCP